MMIRILLAPLLTLCLFNSTALGGDRAGTDKAQSQTQVSVLEGVLKIHSKYLFKYYITGFGDGQKCALFGDEKLKDIKPGSTIRVEGRLGTRFHPGGSDKNPSPFGRTWFIYMDVESVKTLREPEEKANKTVPPHLPPGTR